MDTRIHVSASAEQRVGVYSALTDLLREFGVDPAPLLAEVGLTAHRLAHPDDRIPFSTVGRTLACAARATGCDHFGLLLGQRATLAHLGILAQIARSSPTFGEALRNFTVHQHLYSDGGAVYLFEDGAVASFGYAIYHPGTEGHNQIYDLAIAHIQSGLSELLGEPFRPHEILLSRHGPADLGPYHRALPIAPRFDAARTEMRFDTDLLERPLPGADPARLRALTVQLEAAGRHNLLNRLRRTLRLQLLHGDTTGDHAAQMLALHRRTLNRRLKRRGTTFQDVLDEVRFETARHLLQLTRIPLPQVALCLGYSNVSSFTRAFHRWAGDTPARFRARGSAKPQHESPSPPVS
jgi:AraC-like DNA-binding protein